VQERRLRRPFVSEGLIKGGHGSFENSDRRIPVLADIGPESQINSWFFIDRPVSIQTNCDSITELLKADLGDITARVGP
jgi:hypothetical protein